jgi:hypothetical protein
MQVTTKLVPASTLDEGDEVFINHEWHVVDWVIAGPIVWTLPDGTKIVKVASDMIGVSLDDEARLVPLYRTTLISLKVACDVCGGTFKCRCSR